MSKQVIYSNIPTPLSVGVTYCHMLTLKFLFRVDVRIVGLPHTPPVNDSDEVYEVAEEITRTMTKR